MLDLSRIINTDAKTIRKLGEVFTSNFSSNDKLKSKYCPTTASDLGQPSVSRLVAMHPSDISVYSIAFYLFLTYKRISSLTKQFKFMMRFMFYVL